MPLPPPLREYILYIETVGFRRMDCVRWADKFTQEGKQILRRIAKVRGHQVTPVDRKNFDQECIRAVTLEYGKRLLLCSCVLDLNGIGPKVDEHLGLSFMQQRVVLASGPNCEYMASVVRKLKAGGVSQTSNTQQRTTNR